MPRYCCIGMVVFCHEYRFSYFNMREQIIYLVVGCDTDLNIISWNEHKITTKIDGIKSLLTADLKRLIMLKDSVLIMVFMTLLHFIFFIITEGISVVFLDLTSRKGK